jgi:hypothetical protein
MNFEVWEELKDTNYAKGDPQYKEWGYAVFNLKHLCV